MRHSIRQAGRLPCHLWFICEVSRGLGNALAELAKLLEKTLRLTLRHT